MQTNNILSYFIKDIKDPLELNKYRYYNISGYYIQIYYHNILLYYHNIKTKHILNHITKVYRNSNRIHIHTSKLFTSKDVKHKILFYKKDSKISTIYPINNSPNFISYNYIINNKKFKYLYKPYLSYKINYIWILIIKIKYYNGSKYMYYNDKYKSKSGISAYKSQILIMNKYELQYISRFFNLYFAHFYLALLIIDYLLLFYI